MTYRYLITKQIDKVLRIYLNRPDKMNAINFEMVEELHYAVSNLDTDYTTAVFIHGNEKAFSAGGDLKEMHLLEQYEAKRRSNYIHKTFRDLYNLPVPVIAFIQGICFGGGLELALHTDFRICDETARFAFPEVKFGMVPGAGGTVQFPLQINEATANYYLTTGEEFDSQKAYSMQLIQKVIKTTDFVNFINDQEAFYNQSDIENIKALKQVILQKRKLDLTDEYEMEAELFSQFLCKNGKKLIKKNFT